MPYSWDIQLRGPTRLCQVMLVVGTGQDVHGLYMTLMEAPPPPPMESVRYEKRHRMANGAENGVHYPMFAVPCAIRRTIRHSMRRSPRHSPRRFLFIFFPMLDIQGAFPLDVTRIIRTTQILICLCKQRSALWYTIKANNLLLERRQ